MFFSLPNSVPFFRRLSGDNAFYNQPDYTANTQKEMAQAAALPVCYSVEIESQIIRIAKLVLSIVVFPIGLYSLVHKLAGTIIIPSSFRNGSSIRRQLDLVHSQWKCKRFTIGVDGRNIDATMMGKPDTFDNKRWVLFSNGNAQLYEDCLENFAQDKKGLTSIVSSLEANVIVFNYPGVSASSGLPDRIAMAKAYRALLTFLEDQENGIGAKEIIGIGLSLGGGVQADALKSHTLKNDIKYVFVKDRTFSSLADVTSSLVGRLVGLIVRIFGWNICSSEYSKMLRAPEIIIQSIHKQETAQMLSEEGPHIVDDGIILPEVSLAKVMMDDATCPRANKVFLGIPEQHNNPLAEGSTGFLADKIEDILLGSVEASLAS